MKATRRHFLKTGLAGSLLLATAPSGAWGMPSPQPADGEPKMKEVGVSNPFHLSFAGYTFAKFDIDTTLKTLQRLDVHYLCIKDFHLPLDSNEAQIKAFHEKCAAHGVTGYGVGPIYMKSEAEVDRAFAYARRVGVKVLVGVPDYEMLPYVDKKMADYPEMRYAIHLHGPDLDIFQDATAVWEKVKDLHPHIGMCLDVGHDLRNGADPVIDLARYHTRVFDMHVKDVTAPTKAGHAIELGRGKIDYKALTLMMRQVRYSGMCSLEYEKDMDDPFLGIAESVGYLKAVFENT